ncbi:hypothetical protein CEXT_676011 [Caerostris extrusa]|uniref:Uncharacterized protein n=1 Tax=Caerostris extrusa TaxID=172846 RepID=A0AAV4X1J7_CAEEX|nr:hypothetical protein CEXT_676011 [Caerostris extrusa]
MSSPHSHPSHSVDESLQVSRLIASLSMMIICLDLDDDQLTPVFFSRNFVFSLFLYLLDFLVVIVVDALMLLSRCHYHFLSCAPALFR